MVVYMSASFKCGSVSSGMVGTGCRTVFGCGFTRGFSAQIYRSILVRISVRFPVQLCA